MRFQGGAKINACQWVIFSRLLTGDPLVRRVKKDRCGFWQEHQTPVDDRRGALRLEQTRLARSNPSQRELGVLGMIEQPIVDVKNETKPTSLGVTDQLISNMLYWTSRGSRSVLRLYRIDRCMSRSSSTNIGPSSVSVMRK